MVAGPSSLGYSQSGLPASGQSVGFQVQGPQGPSAAPPGWFPAPATGKALPSSNHLAIYPNDLTMSQNDLLISQVVLTVSQNAGLHLRQASTASCLKANA